MFKNLFKSFFILLLSNSFLEVITAKTNNVEEESQNISGQIESSEIEENSKNTTSEGTQPQLIPLTEEEIQQFRASCSLEENELVQEFAQELSQHFNNFKSNPLYLKLEEMCSSRGLSLQIVLSMIPCKITNKITNNDETKKH